METIEITDGNFDSVVLQSKKTALVDFSAEWCGPCKVMTPLVNLLAAQFKDIAVVGKLDVDSNPETTARYGVRNMPTFLIFKNGEVADRVIGAVPLSVLEQKVQAALKSL